MKCKICDKSATSCCKACKTVWYCGKDCQSKDWNRGHKDICETMSISQNVNEDVDDVFNKLLEDRLIDTRLEIQRVKGKLVASGKIRPDFVAKTGKLSEEQKRSFLNTLKLIPTVKDLLPKLNDEQLTSLITEYELQAAALRAAEKAIEEDITDLNQKENSALKLMGK